MWIFVKPFEGLYKTSEEIIILSQNKTVWTSEVTDQLHDHTSTIIYNEKKSIIVYVITVTVVPSMELLSTELTSVIQQTVTPQTVKPQVLILRTLIPYKTLVLIAPYHLITVRKRIKLDKTY